METNSLKKAAARIKGAGNGAEGNGELETKKTILPPTVRITNTIGKYKAQIAEALPSVMTPERFSRIVVTTVSSSPKLIQSLDEDPKSLFAAVLQGAQLGMEMNTPLGQAYLVPYNCYDKVLGKYVMKCNFQLGYQGVIDLCYRSGEVSLIDAHTVYEKDEFDYELGLNPRLHHVPFRGYDRGQPIGYYGIFKTKGGATGFKFMYREAVVEHAKQFSKSYDAKKGVFYGPWESDFTAMAKKTVLLQALKYAPKKSDFTRALLTDNTTKSTLAKDMMEVQNDDYIDTDSEYVGEKNDGGDNAVIASDTAPTAENKKGNAEEQSLAGFVK